MKLEDIYTGGGNLISALIRKELIAQGHYLTGNLSTLLEFRIAGRVLSGWAPNYAAVINEGLRPDQINYKKMFPGMIRYFKLRGLPDSEAVRAAHFTILKWQREGMSTQASKRFSSTGGRQHFIESAFLYPDIDLYFTETFDFAVDEEFSKVKNETV